jgi:hypothetical protein
MTLYVREWVQNEWTTGAVNRYAYRGDFNDMHGLAPSFNGRRLERGPDWSNHVEHADFIDVRGMFYDETNERYVLVGTKESNSQLSTGYFNSSWTFNPPDEIVAALDDIGGASMQNVSYFDGALWVIGDNLDVYRGTDYTAACASFYATSDAHILVPYGGRMYMITNLGHIYRQDDAGTAFESYFNPVADYTPLYAAPFKGYLLIVGLHADARISIYRLSIPSATHLHEMAYFCGPTKYILDTGSSFAIHADALFFTLGPNDGVPASGEHTAEVFYFDGSKLQKFCDFVETVEVGSGTAGLLTWEDKLIYYVMTGSDARFRAMTGRTFTRYAPAAMEFTNLNIASVAESINEAMIVTAHDAEDDQGIHYATKENRFDGHWDTAWLDFGHPGKTKRLETLTVLMDDAAANYEVFIHYRIDDESSWTTSVDAADGSKIVQATSIGVDFTLLQVRVEIDDSTGNDLDIGIEALSVIYTVDE